MGLVAKIALWRLKTVICLREWNLKVDFRAANRCVYTLSCSLDHCYVKFVYMRSISTFLVIEKSSYHILSYLAFLIDLHKRSITLFFRLNCLKNDSTIRWELLLYKRFGKLMQKLYWCKHTWESHCKYQPLPWPTRMACCAFYPFAFIILSWIE